MLVVLRATPWSARGAGQIGDGLVVRFYDYLTRYKQEVATIVATERYRQEVPVHSAGGAYRVPAAGVVTRNLLSDIVMASDADGLWLGLRVIEEVDGRTAHDSDRRIEQILTNPGANSWERLRALAIESARMNLGSERDINLPLLPLQLLDSSNRQRFVFRVGGTRTIRDTRCVGLQFSETERPTIVRSVTGGNLVSSGIVWIEPDTGAVRRIETRCSADDIGAPPTSMQVEFEMDSQLHLLLPSEMRETFASETGIGEGRAGYRNYRRFRTDVRIKN